MPHWSWPWHAEIESFPSAVMKARHPGSINLGDVNADDFVERALAAGKPDVIVWGAPCQSFSVAGKRFGLNDPRGDLTFTGLKIISQIKPEWFVYENVPGLVSMDDGAVLTAFLDACEEMEYVVDFDILDAQFCGVPQRRRRLFVCAQRAESILKLKTLSSALTISQCLIEILLLVLIAASDQSTTDSENLTFDARDPCGSLRCRMKLFGLQKMKAEQASTLAENLDAILASSGSEPSASDLERGSARSKIAKDTRLPGSNAGTERWQDEFQSTAPSWKRCLADALQIASECIISTPRSEITNQKIYTCAQTTLHIIARITQSQNSSPAFWSLVQSASTAIKGFTNYARFTSGDLFTAMEWLQPWRDFIEQAERAERAIANLRDRNFGQEVLPFSEGVRGNNPTRKEAGERVAPTVEARANAGGAGWGTDFLAGGGPATDEPARAVKAGEMGHRHDPSTDNYVVAGAVSRKWAKGTGGPAGDECYNLVTGTLSEGAARHSAGNKNESDMLVVDEPTSFDCKAGGNTGFSIGEKAGALRGDGNGGGHSAVLVTPILEAGARTGREGHEGTDGIGIGEPGDPMFTLQATKQHAIVFDTTQVTHKDNYSNPKPGDPCHPLAAGAHPPAIAFQPRHYSGRSAMGGAPSDVAHPLTSEDHKGDSQQVVAFSCKDHGADAAVEQSPTLRAMEFDASHANGGGQVAVAIPIHSDADRAESSALTPSPDAEGKVRLRDPGLGVGDDGAPMFSLTATKPHAVAFQTRIARNGRGQPEEVVPALNGSDAGETSDMRPCVAVFKPSHFTRDKDGAPSDVSPPLSKEADKGDQEAILMQGVAVRRLTPRECERLMGMKDDFTLVKYRGNPASDSVRYKALGNSMVVPELTWLLSRIEKFEAMR